MQTGSKESSFSSYHFTIPTFIFILKKEHHQKVHLRRLQMNSHTTQLFYKKYFIYVFKTDSQTLGGEDKLTFGKLSVNNISKYQNV